MRIAMIYSTPFPPREGIGFYVWNLSKILLRQGHQVQLITRGGPRPTLYEKVEGIHIWRPPFLPAYPYHVHLHGLFVSALIRKLEPTIDIFHLHSPLIPVISTKQPVMLTFHSTIPLDAKLTRVVDLYTFLMKLQAPVSYQLELGNIKKATRVNAVSPWVAKALQTYPNHPTDIEIMWNGVDSNAFSPVDQNGRQEKLVLTVCRLGPGKGLQDLIESAKFVVQKDPEIRFLIVGEGGLRVSLEKQIHKNGLDRIIRMTGHISERDRLIEMYRVGSLFVLPSYHEGMPTVILEAMACGCPVLTTNVGGIPFLIRDGENGALISPGDPQKLGNRILELIGNPQLLAILGKQARVTVEDRFSWKIICSSYIQQYQSMLQGM